MNELKSRLTIAAVPGWILSAVLLATATANADEARVPRNFIVVFADDFGYGDIGCYRS